MDLLENVATELGFQFHLYLVRDEKYGAKYTAMTDAQLHNLQSSGGEASASSLSAIKDGGDEDGRDETITSGGRRAKETGDTMVDIDPDWDQSNGIDFNLQSVVRSWRQSSKFSPLCHVLYRMLVPSKSHF